VKLLDRYILRGFLINYVIALTVMIGLYVVIDLFFNLDEFTKEGDRFMVGAMRRVLDYYGHQMMLYFAQLSGVITVVAACGTLARMHRLNELTAVLASGTSLHRVALPLVVAGLFMNALWLFDQEALIPRFAHKLARRHDDLEGRMVAQVWFLPDRENALLSARSFLPRTGEIFGLMVLHRDAQGRLTHITRADTARWDEEAHAWALTVGIEEHPAQVVSGTGGDFRRPVRHYPSDLRPSDVAVQQASQWTSYLSLKDLSEVQRRFADDRQFVVAKHARITAPIMNMILLLLGLPFFLTRERVSMVVSGGRCILLCGACFAFGFFTQNMDFSAMLNQPALPVWLPVLIFGPIAVYAVEGLKT